MKTVTLITIITIFSTLNGNAQSKLSLSGDFYYGFHHNDNIHSFGIGTRMIYKISPKYSISFSIANIFGESRGGVPSNNEVNLPIKDFETYSKESLFFDNFIAYYPTTFNKYHSIITDVCVLERMYSNNLYAGGGASIVYFDFEKIDYMLNSKFWYKSNVEENFLLLIPRQDRFIDLGINIIVGYKIIFKEYMFLNINTSINYYFKSKKMLFKNSIGLGFYF